VILNPTGTGRATSDFQIFLDVPLFLKTALVNPLPKISPEEKEADSSSQLKLP